ncbi:hypothetical protein SAMN05428957_10769 [Oryzisolibacter propanilivorax]|uniref:Uncharacterized protein n=1 Tax=Oryzisolibacter propanilivorax TaxID=1527607 RepID=A0A1G9TYA1_9BURK|nr:hypothetical protein [Oryzisolibacter propanilivorax]SDM52662.1 hypothetical protein SAMN05428957_10769 [Oryzisolibacter propanilivorax]
MFPKYTREALAVLLGCTVTFTAGPYVLTPEGIFLRMNWRAWQDLTDEERQAIAGSPWPMACQNQDGTPKLSEDGTALIGLCGPRPLLRFPCTAFELWHYDRDTGGALSEHLPPDAEGWIAERLAEGGTANEAVAHLARVLLPDAPPQDGAQAHEVALTLGCYARALDIEQWARHPAVAPAQAARLLCGCDPLSENASDRDAQTLTHLFESWSTCHPGPRTLAQWARIAREQGARHCTEIGRAVEYLIDQTGSALGQAPTSPTPSAEERQARRWQACIDAGLVMPTDTYASYPRGFGAVAEGLRITRQALKQDLDAYRERVFNRQQ